MRFPKCAIAKWPSIPVVVGIAGVAAWGLLAYEQFFLHDVRAAGLRPEEIARDNRLFLLTSVVWFLSLVIGCFALHMVKRQSEESFLREKEFTENFLRAAPDIVLVLDPKGRIVRCNPFLAELTGWPMEELLGKDWLEIFLPRVDRGWLKRLLQDTLEGPDGSTGVNVIFTRDGQRRDVEWSNRPLHDTHGKVIGVVAVGRDVTELREVQRQALQTERLTAIGQMVAGLAHDSGNALQRSQACIEMLAIQVADQPEAIKLIGRIQAAQDHLHQSYKEIRRYAAPITLSYETIRVEEFVQAAWDDLEPARANRQAELKIHPHALDATCRVDRREIERVFRNILENAIEACDDPIQIEVESSQTESQDGRFVEIVVRDNGVGVPCSNAEDVLKPFYTTKMRGTGLGMAICQRIVEAHDGRICVSSGNDSGVTVVVTLPQEERYSV